MKFFIDGHLSQRGSDILGLIGVAVVFAAAFCFDDWSGFWFWTFALVGGFLGYLGAYGGLARKFGFEAPFTNDPLGWRKAKKTYQEPGEDTAKVPKDDGP